LQAALTTTQIPQCEAGGNRLGFSASPRVDHSSIFGGGVIWVSARRLDDKAGLLTPIITCFSL
jgi:hypothetical protein